MNEYMNPFVIFLLSLAGAGIGAYFGSYLREKGKNLATREDVDRLVRTTEEIKSQIGGDLWVRQRVWDFKRDTYASLIERLSVMRQLTIENLSLVSAKVTPGLDASEATTMSRNLSGMVAAIADLRSRLAVGRLFLSTTVIAALAQVDHELDAVSIASSADVVGALKVLMRYADNARECLIAEARNDLKL